MFSFTEPENPTINMQFLSDENISPIMEFYKNF